VNDFYRWPRLWILGLTLVALLACVIALGSG
jgi:hypothetical protein